MVLANIFHLGELPLMAFGLGRRDPTAIFYFILMWLGIQLIVWLVGRDSLDNEWWRSAALAALSTVTPLVIFVTVENEGAAGFVAAAVLLTLLVWIISGFLYEPDLREKVLISVLVPALAAGVFPIAVWLRRLILGELLS
jgi:hypothetical protein